MKKVLILVLISFVVLGCSSNKDMEKVSDAQRCLDKATSATAAACMTPIEGINSKEASLVKCGGGFIMEGFDEPTRLVSALQNAKTSGGGVTTVFSVLAFHNQVDTTSNVTLAEKTYNYCKASENTGFTLIAALSNMATKITGGSLTPDTMFDTANLATTISNISDPATLGAIASAAFEASCSSNTAGTGSGSSTDLCSSLSTYNSSGASDKEVGCCLKEKMSNPASLCDSSNATYTTCIGS